MTASDQPGERAYPETKTPSEEFAAFCELEFERRLKARIAEGGKSEPPPELFDHLRALIHQEHGNEDPGS